MNLTQPPASVLVAPPDDDNGGDQQILMAESSADVCLAVSMRFIDEGASSEDLSELKPCPNAADNHQVIIGDADQPPSGEKFADVSFSCLKRDHPLRKAAISLVTWRWFERLSIGMIVVNCIALGLADPCDSRCVGTRCRVLQMVEHVIFGFFASEMLAKMLAMGVLGKNAYLGDGWNCFDSFIILIGTLEYCFIEGDVNFSAIRAFRVFRPLRAINRIPGLRLLVTLLLDILPMLGNVLVFCLFIFFIFGIAGVQLWSGTLRHRCFFPRSMTEALIGNDTSNSTQIRPPYYMPPYYRTSAADFVCSPESGMLTCDQLPLFEKLHDSMCAELFDGHPQEEATCGDWIKHYTDCRPDGPNPEQGTLSFDNLGLACIAIFTVISLEGWADVMYLMQDGYSFWVWSYFVGLIMVGSLFAVNLCLVVIATQFSETKKRETARMKLERRANGPHMSRLSSIATIGEDNSIYRDVLDLLAYSARHAFRKVRAICLKKRKPAPVNATHRESPVRAVETNSWVTIIQEKNDQFRLILRRILEHNVAVGFIMGAILVNTIVMGAEHHNQPEAFTKAMDIMNLVFTIFFTVEIVIKLYAYGIVRFIYDGFNMLDLIIVVINLAELKEGGSNLSVLRTFRLVRVVKIVRFMPSLQRQLLVMMKTIDNIAPFFVMLSFFLYIFALLGMSLFGCRFCPQVLDGSAATSTPANNGTAPHSRKCHLAVLSIESGGVLPYAYDASSDSDDRFTAINMQEPCPRSNFDSVLTSLFTVLQIFTQDAWSAVLKDGMRYTSVYASLYFVALVTIGNYVIFNLLVAILVEGFASENDSGVLEVYGASPQSPQSNLSNQSSIVKKSDKTEARKSKKLSVSFIDGQSRIQSDPPTITVQNFDEPSEEPTTLFQPKVRATASNGDNKSGSAFITNCRTSISSKKGRVVSRLGECLASRLDYSLFVLSPNSLIRRFFLSLIGQRAFDNFILVVILANCVLIALERPSIEPDSAERYWLDLINYVLNGVFAFEASARILAKGLVVGQGTYLRDMWNVLDFFLVNCSTIHTLLHLTSSAQGSAETKILELFRVLRILRALRPLRVVNRSPGLKIALETLMVSIKPIGNIIIITISFFFVFAVLGLQLFRGCFYKCVVPDVAPPTAAGEVNSSSTATFSLTDPASSVVVSTPKTNKVNLVDHNFELLQQVETRTQCEELGFSWRNEGFNFDNMGDALMTLFVFATFDGWVDITRAGVDCVAVDRQPIQDYNPWRTIYFISFLLIVCFFMLNMFVGVVVNNFQKVQKRVHAEMEAKREAIKKEKLLARLTKKRKQEASKRSKMLGIRKQNAINLDIASDPTRPQRLAFAYADRTELEKVSDPNFFLKYPPWRRAIHKVVVSPQFELVISLVTLVAMAAMALEFYNMPPELLLVVRVTSFLFAALITVEIGFKLVALGFHRFFLSRWNQLDLVVVVMSIAGILAEELSQRVGGYPTQLVQLIRILRIVRVLKLLRMAQGIQRLLHTVSQALPQVGNLSLLFLLLFFIYASLGVELFGKFDCTYVKCEGLSRHANFQHFGMSLLTLFRIFTGDNWNGILRDMLTFSSDDALCAAHMIGNNTSDIGGSSVECTTVYLMSPFYFVSFVLISQFILINVVIAVLMSQLEGAHFMEKMQADQIGQEVEHQVAVLEGVVQSVCPALVDQLQERLHTTRDEAVSIVATEYALRHRLSVDDLTLSPALRHSLEQINGSHGELSVNSSLASKKSMMGSRSSSLVAIDQAVLEEVFKDLGEELKASEDVRQTPIDAIDWFVEQRQYPMLDRSTSVRVRPVAHRPPQPPKQTPLVRTASEPLNNDNNDEPNIIIIDNLTQQTSNDDQQNFRKRLPTVN